jgi:hypothetical protein
MHWIIEEQDSRERVSNGGGLIGLKQYISNR